MPFEGGYDDLWILQDVVKDESYHLTVMGSGLASIEDDNLRRLVGRMVTDVTHHVEELASLSHNRRQHVSRSAGMAGRGAPAYSGWEAGDRAVNTPPVGGTTYRQVPPDSGSRRGWNSPIPQGRGAYEGTTESQIVDSVAHNEPQDYTHRVRGLDAERHESRQTQSSYRGVPRYRTDEENLER